MSGRMVLLAGFLTALVSGCGTGGSVAGRPGGDQTENGILARIMDSTGAPAAGARVKVRPADWTASGGSSDSTTFAALDLRTDADGGFRLTGLPSGQYRVEVRSSGLALQFGAVLDGKVFDAGTRQLSATGTIQGRVSTGSGSVVAVAGLDHFAIADSAGRFRLDSLPSGVMQTRTSDGSYSWVTLAPYATALAGLLRADSAAQILLEDFEDGDTRNRWAPLVGGGGWYVALADSIHATPVGLPSNPGLGLTATGTSRGEVFHCAFSFDSARTNPWAEIGVSLGGPPADLRALTEIVFMAKGSGAISMHVSSNAGGRIQAFLKLPSVWTEVRVPVDSFHIQSYTTDPTLTVSNLLASSTGVAWEFTGTGELWLDEIRLVGPTPRSAWGALQPP